MEQGGGNISRRGFIKATTVLGASAALAGLGASEAKAAPPKEWDYETDVLVIGAGMSGMSAALAAADGGAKTLVLEVASITGGCSVFSGGILHTKGYRTWEDYNTYSEGKHDPVLAKVYVETFWNEFTPFLLKKGAVMHRGSSHVPETQGDYVFGLKGGGGYIGGQEPGYQGHRRFHDSLVKAFTDMGGTIRLKTRAIQLYVNDNGDVIGSKARVWKKSPVEPEQKLIHIKAKKTIVASGEWVGNKGLKDIFLGRNHSWSAAIGGPYNNGEGLLMCLEVGAALSASMSDVYVAGAYCPVNETFIAQDPVAFEEMLKRVEWKDMMGPFSAGRARPPAWIGRHAGPYYMSAKDRTTAIYVNQDGNRFVDEGSKHDAKYPRQFRAIGYQRQGFAWMIGDKLIHDEDPSSAIAINTLKKKGCKVLTANSIEELATALEAEGMYKAQFLKTISEYNLAIENGKTKELSPPRSDDFYPGFWKIGTPPFHAIKVFPYFSINFGGILMNENAQALDLQRRPIPNLYTPPAVGGGVYRDIYMGANALAGTYGYLAGKHAAAGLKG